ncbi:unnamed protein product [Symbiodinium necroappetens]|uniref:Uncharacterized protein n=1 Tax=Symbiodinium necroappetens TaxID=1628268 RepID=A0A812X2S2_9DINO|nr:unnamed protein product [Symbiodinium necroappetens]
MYATRDASSTWQRDYSELMKKYEFVAGKAWPCIFYCEKEDIRLLVHGDFFCLADDEGHAYVDEALKERYEYRCDGHIGPNHDKRMVVLNRLICYEPETGKVTYEADPRHVEALVRELSLETAKAVRLPAEKKKQGDRPDIAEATKSLARLVYEYHPQRFQKDLTVYCDSDHAGCLITRRLVQLG